VVMLQVAGLLQVQILSLQLMEVPVDGYEGAGA
jgi:hypothetical protein